MHKFISKKSFLPALALIVISGSAIGESSFPGETSLERGKAVFEELCSACHGFDGIKQIPQAPSFARDESLDKDDDVLLKAIRLGKGDIMQPWKDELNEQEMKDVLIYIRTFSKQKTTKLKIPNERRN